MAKMKHLKTMWTVPYLKLRREWGKKRRIKEGGR